MTTEDATTTPPNATTIKSKSTPVRPKDRMQAETVETRRTAALVLEVLGGVRTPTEAAEVLGVSLPRYYGIEARALEGLVAACRKRQRGPQPSAARDVKRLQAEVDRLREECARHQALLRVAQRAVGLKAPAAMRPGARDAKPAPRRNGDPKKSGKRTRKKKRATARALRAVRQLGVSTERAESSTVDPTASSV